MAALHISNNATLPTTFNPIMPVDDSTLTKRYAFKIALIYLLIRGIPDLVLYAVTSLPVETFTTLTQNHGAWLRHIYPVIPVPLINVPLGFQQALALLPVLVIEALLVFVFSAWFLRRKPWAAHSTNRSRWVIFILATVIGSCAIRHQLLAFVQTLSTQELLTRQNDTNWIDDLPFLLMKAHWSLTVVLYAMTPLWAGLPTWLHFRFAKMPADAAADTDGIASANVTGMAIPLQRATVFVSFLLGCLILHIALVQITYMGLWPWLAELSRIHMPQDGLDEMGLALSLSQIVFAMLMCALAAYVYVRRLTIDTTSTVRLVVKPLLAGVVAYLLTCFLLLALTWFVIWLNPKLISSFSRQFSYVPQSGIVYIIALNIGALVLLCLMSARLRESSRRWSAALAVFVLCAAVPSYVGWTLVASNLGIAGGKPGVAATGELGDARWRNMEQWCTGVVETRHGTWLVGRYEDTGSASYVPNGVPDLSTLVTGDEEGNTQRGFSLFGSRPVLTTLARLQDDGTFKMVATLPDVACMVVSPASETLFLLTGIRPESSSSFKREQSAVFRSTDHGVTWEWLESGFMPEVQHLAWSVKPTFSSDQDIWAWGKEPPSEDAPQSSWQRREAIPSRHAVDGTELKPTALFYSMDQGKTSTVIYSPEPLIAPVAYLREIAGEPNADFSRRRDMDQERFVVQLSDEHAYAWVSEFMWYYVGEDSHRLVLTTRAELSRPGPDDEWQITHITRQPDVRIQHLTTSIDGRTYAILQDEEGEWLARLDTQNGEWIERQRTPSVLPGWLAEDRTSTRYFWSNGDYQVVSQWGRTVVSRLLIPFSEEPAEINTDAHFYTRDGGRNWHQLAIPGYLGVMGLSPRGSKVYWTKGNWYSNDEPLQWHYDLAK